MDPQFYGQITFDKARKKYPVGGEKQSLQYMVLGKLDNYKQKNETEPLSYTISKN